MGVVLGFGGIVKDGAGQSVARIEMELRQAVESFVMRAVLARGHERARVHSLDDVATSHLSDDGTPWPAADLAWCTLI